MVLPTISVVHNYRNKSNKKELYSIHLRVTIERIAKYYEIKVPQKVSAKEWSGADGHWVKNTHQFSFEINNKILEKKNILHDLVKRSYNLNKNLDFESVFLHLRRKGDNNSFYGFMQSYIDKPPEKLELNTIKKYKTTLKHLKEFKTQLSFSDIDSLFITDFYKFLQVNKSIAGGACKKYMDSFKKVIKQARKENYVDPAQMESLFDDLKIKVPKPKRIFLEPKEIISLKNLKFSKDQQYLERDRDLFLFQIYTGYYYKDLFIFTKEQLLDDEEHGLIITGARDKNGNETIIPLFKFPHAGYILRKYSSAEHDKNIFNSCYLIEEPVYNRHLKDLATLAGIKKNISNKVARHTNAQLWIRYGAEGAILSKMMGHTREATTKNYYNVNIPEIVEGTKRADFRKLGI